MARIRTIKPDFFRHEALYEAERASGLPLRIAFAGLWTAADREGRFRWQPRTLKLDCLPYDDVDFAAILHALAEGGFIVKYQGEKPESHYGYIPGWNKHQHINLREAQSALPAPPDAPTNQECADTCEHVQTHGEGKGREEEGKELEDVADDARERCAISPEGFALAERLCTAVGWTDLPQSTGTPWIAQKWLNGGWNADLCVATVQRVKAAARKKINTLAYFENAIAEAHAEQAKPLPVAVIENEQKVIHVEANKRHAGGAYGASKDRFRSAHAELKEYLADTVEEDGGGGAGPAAELLRTTGRG